MVGASVGFAVVGASVGFAVVGTSVGFAVVGASVSFDVVGTAEEGSKFEAEEAPSEDTSAVTGTLSPLVSPGFVFLQENSPRQMHANKTCKYKIRRTGLRLAVFLFFMGNGSPMIQIGAQKRSRFKGICTQNILYHKFGQT